MKYGSWRNISEPIIEKIKKIEQLILSLYDLFTLRQLTNLTYCTTSYQEKTF